ncbi:MULTISPECIES: hypothetical protein [unclassified Leisingera]|uniref:hypothetical protein n=2 Tax=Leisingera TaxID=191028 RepID=UPI0002F0FA07|nr:MULTISPECIES: hypothetical protein [unclassified Leisingera]KIC25867.1 hypothetical protein RA24_19125 [Leisingera sp. ANG-M6]KIC15669.1 hypothetical protein RA21_15675 [Leisingera sp. ANG-DT]KIC23016.1 hypothetical protein RA23_16435 [Leisingera sp. ANG-S3]KIC30501.1 hypothetical protein RA25_19075 [Leisingera sp. ANG-S5]KIC52403.1 hypothetical protein RA22_16110 [Leisingera sp. ANG-S]
MMKFLVVTALAISFSAPAVLAGGGKPSDRELAERRCGNNGEGNDAEILKYSYKKRTWVCIKNVDIAGPYFEPDEDHPRDVDPN